MRKRGIRGIERTSFSLAEHLRPSYSPLCPLLCVLCDSRHYIIVSFLFFLLCLHRTKLRIHHVVFLTFHIHTKCVKIWLECLSPAFCAPFFEKEKKKTQQLAHTHLPLLDTPLGGSCRSLRFTEAETPFPVLCTAQSQTCFLCHFPFLWRTEGLCAF